MRQAEKEQANLANASFVKQKEIESAYGLISEYQSKLHYH